MEDIITFDCYGTLIDWQEGISTAMVQAARLAGVEVDRSDVMPAYLRVEPTIQAREYRSYREILAEAASLTASQLGWEIGPECAGFLAASLTSWQPFPDTNPALEQLKADGYRLGILSNIDDDLLAGTIEQFTVEFDLLVSAESVRSYKPAFPHFLAAREALKGCFWLHAAQSYFHDVEPACGLGIPVVWVNRDGADPTGTARPTGEVESLAGFVEWLETGRSDLNSDL